MGRKILLIAGAASVAVALGGASVAAASNTLGDDQPSFQVVTVESGDNDDSSQPLSAADRDKAGHAALAQVGRGRVGEVERENNGASAFEVEVVLDDATNIDVELGADFQVLHTGAPESD
ncbi:hypothetical protein [Arthrobacter sp. ISL-30]|uniref:PepSY domain-containing protein n=1 Tax=Arthrobacter sp. ISL-30 TaxID=2819109 RepID=UPI001BE78DE4|nr:hypothetical protein [Arthrobacter sp. ISL-30]MBT2512751.1 hypothetical protein [Arthrobacter sp. ISL-30]